MSISWGILGTGTIAGLFASDLRLLPDADLVAVGSRAAETAEAFGERFGIPNRHDSYEALVADDAVDVIYVASPHAFHAEHSRMAMAAGRHVLCEKPLALSEKQAAGMIDTARSEDIFLMEALWTRFLPVMADVRECIADGAVGDPVYVRADIGVKIDFDPEDRLFDPSLGGGALLDLGIYPLFLIREVLGVPSGFDAWAVFADTGVDAQCSGVMDFQGGAQATWTASTRADAGRTAAIAGPEGRLEGQRSWWKGGDWIYTSADGDTERLSRPFEGNGYQFEAAHVMECLREERRESPEWPLSASRDLLRLMDAHRERWGLHYPQEEPA